MTYTWPCDRACLPDIDDLDAEEDKLRLQVAIDTAVMVLWSLTGRQYAIETVTARPCPRSQEIEDYSDMGAGVGFMPMLIDGGWVNESTCGSGRCNRNSPNVIELPGPVVSIESVTVDGVPIDATSWAQEGNYLYRTGGEAWPDQDLSVPMGQPGSWYVTYTRGVAPPPGASLMVGQLAKEFWAICSGGKCRLPRRWQSITRQGVTVTRADPTNIIAQGQTGIAEIDTWVHALNPNQLMQPAAVASPDYSSVPR